MTDNHQENLLYPASPEEALLFHSSTDPWNQDVLQAIVTRTGALLDMLTGYLATPANQRAMILPDHRLMAYLWQINGNVDLIQKWLKHSCGAVPRESKN